MYRFPLQRVLELRAMAEEQRAIALARAQTEASSAMHAYETLERTRRQEMERMDLLQRDGASVGELLGLRRAIDRTFTWAKDAREVVQRAEELVAARRAELQTASMNRRVLERLRERGRTAWHVEDTRSDSRTMDELALSRFTRARRADG